MNQDVSIPFGSIIRKNLTLPKYFNVVSIPFGSIISFTIAHNDEHNSVSIPFGSIISSTPIEMTTGHLSFNSFWFDY